MHPVPTDAELLQSFSPLEHEFKDWFDRDDYTIKVERAYMGGPPLKTVIETMWPEVENVYELWNIWFRRWVQRRWKQLPATDQEFKEFIRRFRIQNAGDLERYDETLDAYDIELVLLGESVFDGIVGGYAVSITENPAHVCGSVEFYENINKRFKEVLGSRGAGSGPMYFGPEDNHLYFQLGSLKYCTGQEWADVKNHAEHGPTGYRIPHREGTWKDTGYSILIRMKDGYPSMHVLAVFDPELEYLVAHGAPGLLYKDNHPEFLVAKVADWFEDMGKNRKFEFKISHGPIPPDSLT